jgi:hypothetical protein
MNSILTNNDHDHGLNGENDNNHHHRLHQQSKSKRGSSNNDKLNPKDSTSNNDDNDEYPHFSQPPQMAFGWFVPHPPPSGPYLWSCIPPGYTLVPVSASQNPLALSEKNDNSSMNVGFGTTLTPPTHPAFGPSEHSLNPPLHSHNPIHSPSLEALANIAVAPTPYSLGDDDITRDSDDLHDKDDKHRDYERGKRMRL